jgi:hypothetical protein
MKRTYLALAVAGTLLPYSQFVPFVREHGLDVQLFFAQLFANRISAFFALDVIVRHDRTALHCRVAGGRP